MYEYRNSLKYLYFTLFNKINRIEDHNVFLSNMGTNDHQKNDNCNLKGLEKLPLIKKLSETYFCINIKYNNNIEANSSVYIYIFIVYKKIFRKILA